MILYIIIILLIIFFHYYYVKVPSNSIPRQWKWDVSEKKFILATMIVMVLLLALRNDNIGLDTIPYKILMIDKMNRPINDIIQTERHEPLYLILTYLIHFTGSYFILKLTIGMLFVGGALNMIFKYSCNTWFSCLCFFMYGFYYLGFNEMRQAVATGIVCYSFQFLVDKKLLKYLAGIIIACLFHYSAIIMFPLIVLIWIEKVKFKYFFAILLLLSIAFANSTTLFMYVNQFSSIEYNIDETTGGWGLLVFQLFILALGLIKKDAISDDRWNVCAFYCIGFAVAMFPLCHTLPTMFRLEKYAWIPMVIFIPNMIEKFDDRITRNIISLLFLSVGLFFAFTQSFTEHNQTMPYLFFWE